MKLQVLAFATALLFSAGALAQNVTTTAPHTRNAAVQMNTQNNPNNSNNPNTANQGNENPEGAPNGTQQGNVTTPATAPMTYHTGGGGGWGLWGLLGLFGFFGLARGGGRRDEVVRTTNIPPR